MEKEMISPDARKATNFIFELGQLKKVKRSGWWLPGIKDPESVAEHSHRSACIGYILAKMENVDAEKVVLNCLFHEIPETRLNDLHKLGQRYIEWTEAENKAIADQLSSLPKEIADGISNAIDKNKRDTTKEGVVARDADLLECAFTAMEYIHIGYTECKDWIENVDKLLKTKSARILFDEMKKTNPANWWHGLKKIER